MSRRLTAAASALTIVLAFAFAPATRAQDPAPPETSAAGKTWFWLRMWPDWIVKFDPATDEIAGKLQLKNGVSHGHWLTFDKKRFIAITGQRGVVEVIDLKSMAVAEEHPFKEDGYIIRVDSVKECPGGTHWYVKVNRVKTMLDHYVIEEPQWLLYRVADKEVEKRMKELPKAIRNGARISPDGKKWHVFGADLVIVDPATLEEEGKVELSRPLYTGMGPLSLRGEDFFDGRNADGYRMFYSMRDPVKKNRTLTGLVDVDLKGMKVLNLKEWGADFRAGGLQVSRDHRIGVAQARGRGGRGESAGEQEITLATYDLEEGKKLREVTRKVRNGLGLAGISPDGKKTYLTGRGHELVVLDENHQPLRTVAFEGEIDGRIHVVVEE